MMVGPRHPKGTTKALGNRGVKKESEGSEEAAEADVSEQPPRLGEKWKMTEKLILLAFCIPLNPAPWSHFS